MEIRPKPSKPKLSPAQAKALIKLDGTYRTAQDLGESGSTLLALATKGLADVQHAEHGGTSYRRRAV